MVAERVVYSIEDGRLTLEGLRGVAEALSGRRGWMEYIVVHWSTN